MRARCKITLASASAGLHGWPLAEPGRCRSRLPPATQNKVSTPTLDNAVAVAVVIFTPMNEAAEDTVAMLACTPRRAQGRELTPS